MRKKRILLLLLLAIICIAAILLCIANFSNTQANTTKNSQRNPNTEPRAEQFVVPENPLGPLGLMSALAIAFGIFALKKERQ